MQFTPKVFDACAHRGRKKKKINISLLHMLLGAGRIIPPTSTGCFILELDLTFSSVTCLSAAKHNFQSS